MSARHAALAVVAVLALAGCSGGGDGQSSGSAAPTSAAGPAASPDVAAWAKGVCTKVAADIAVLEQVPDADPRNPVEYRDALDRYFGAIEGALGTMGTTFTEAGPPPVDGGADLLAQSSAQLDSAKSAVRGARAALAKLDTSSEIAFQGGFASVAEELQKLQDTSGVVKGLRSNPEVDAAFQATPECAALDETAATPTSTS